jgi:hypothetical protein
MVMAVILAILVLLPVVAVVVLLEVLFLPAAVSRAAGKGPRCYPEALKVDYVA